MVVHRRKKARTRGGRKFKGGRRFKGGQVVGSFGPGANVLSQGLIQPDTIKNLVGTVALGAAIRAIVKATKKRKKKKAASKKKKGRGRGTRAAGRGLRRAGGHRLQVRSLPNVGVGTGVTLFETQGVGGRRMQRRVRTRPIGGPISPGPVFTGSIFGRGLSRAGEIRGPRGRGGRLSSANKLILQGVL